jgi:DNA-binding IclR family transcriptional regulator
MLLTMSSRPARLDEPSDALASDSTIVSVERALRLIEWLADARDGLPFPELRRLLDVNQGICFKLLATLEQTGYVFRNEETGNYCLTYKISNLGLRKLLSRRRLLDQCTSVLRALADESGELARLAIVEDDRLTWVLSIAGRKHQNSSLQIDARTSSRIGLHTHASGKAWLSTMPSKQAAALLQQHGIARMTKHSLGSLERVRAELDKVRQRGYALSYEEVELGIGAVAAPVLVRQLDGSMTCVATVSLAAPSSRMSRDDLDRHGPMLRSRADELAANWPLDEIGRGLPDKGPAGT